MQTNNTEEIFDIVDNEDNVIGSAPRSKVHAKNLKHRAVHAIFFNAKGEILLQKRSKYKDLYPNIYTTSVSGHVDSKESYEDALVRECAEELGVNLKISDFKYIGKINACEETGWEFTKVYTIVFEGKFTFPSEEVEALDYMPIAKFEEEIKNHSQNFTPSFLKVYSFYKNV